MSRVTSAPLILLLLALFVGCAGSAPLETEAPQTQAPTPGATAAPATPSPVPPTATPEAVTPPPTTQPATPAPPDDEELALEGRIVNREHQYAVTLPPGWLRMDLDEEFMELLREELGGEAAQELVDLFGGQLEAMIRAGMSLIAFREEEMFSSDFATNVNVLAVASGGMSLDLLEQLNVGQIEQLPGLTGEVTTERVELPAGDALYLTYGLADSTAEGETHQYLFLADGNQYWLTVSGVAGDPILADEARFMAESFEFLGSD